MVEVVLVEVVRLRLPLVEVGRPAVVVEIQLPNIRGENR